MGADYKPAPEDTIYGNVAAGQAAALTRYYSSDGIGAAADVSKGYVITVLGLLRELWVITRVPAGAAETFTYTVYLNGAPTVLTCTIAGAVQVANNVAGLVPIVPGDRVTLRITTSAAAAQSDHHWGILHQH